MIKPILQMGNEILRSKCYAVSDFPERSIGRLREDLGDTLHDAQRRFGYGRGIAAPQIGELKRVVFVDTPGFKSIMVNPRLVQASGKVFEVWDSCFSFSVAFFVLVKRHYGVIVEYLDQGGQAQTVEAEDGLSELLQHEIDHLDGVLAVDRMVDSKIIMRSEWEKRRRKST